MKYLLSLSVLVLVACGGESSESVAAAEEAVPAAVEESPAEQATPSIPSPYMVEYVWHKAGDNFTEEALAALTKQWAAYPGEGGWDLMYASVITPRFADDNFDFIWVMMWPSQEARDAAWASWAENFEPQWLKDSESIFTYSADGVFGWAPTTVRQPSVMNSTGQGISDYSFCTFNEGHDQSSLDRFVDAHNVFMDSFESTDGATGYWAATLTPFFEPPEDNPLDYMWFNGFTNDAERAAGWEAYNNAPHADGYAAMSTCTDPAVFDSRVIYMPAS